jgi:hypothetical protein
MTAPQRAGPTFMQSDQTLLRTSLSEDGDPLAGALVRAPFVISFPCTMTFDSIQ